MTEKDFAVAESKDEVEEIMNTWVGSSIIA